MLVEAIVIVGVGAILWAYQAIRPPPPRVCDTKNGPPVDSPRARLSDGRYLAYKEIDVPRENASYKVIVVHGFDSSKDIYLPISKELIHELGIYMLTYDRAGYGESDPNPKRTVKSEAFDVQELADALQLGPKFYVLGVSIDTAFGAQNTRNYHFLYRLAGASLLVSVINYWWPSFPRELRDNEFTKRPKKDQLKLWIARNAPSLLYWYMTQKWFPSCSSIARDPIIFSKRDFSILKEMIKVPNPNEHKSRQQGEHESLYRDLKVCFGNWEFDPMELKNPFPENKGAIQLWQGYEDNLVPVKLQRFLAQKLTWIKYYEVPDGGHLLIHDPGLCNSIFKALLLKEEPSRF